MFRNVLILFFIFILVAKGESIKVERNYFFTGDIGKVLIKGYDEKKRYSVVLKNRFGRWEFPVVDKEVFFRIPLFVKGKYISLYLKKNGKVIFSKRLKIIHKKYRISRITVRERKITKSVLKRIRKENILLRKTFKKYTKKLFKENRLHKPLRKLVVSTPFGAKRIINGKKRSIHWGTDFEGKKGEPVYSALSGIVVIAKDMFFTGKTVVINHGLGLYTLYAHLSEIDVREGDFVKIGEIIGKVGSTGRSTAPHLHFGVYINDIKVDPMILLKRGL